MQEQQQQDEEFEPTTLETTPVLSPETLALISDLTANVTTGQLADRKLAKAALERAAAFSGELRNSTGNFWDTRDFKGNLLIGKFIFNSAVGLIPGTTLEQHGASDYFARDILGALDDQYVVDRLDQVHSGRPLSLMGYVSGGTSDKGQIGIQLNPEMLYQPLPASDRLYQAVVRCAWLLLQNGFNPRKPLVMHAELNNRYGISHSRKEEYDLLRSVGVPEVELPRYRTQVYLTMPEVWPCNEDLLCEELVRHDLGYWARN